MVTVFWKADKSTDKMNTSLSNEVEVSGTVLTCSELISTRIIYS